MMDGAPNDDRFAPMSAYEQRMDELEVEPHNIEVEQALLGALLINNDLVHRVTFLKQEHFYDPVHARIYKCILLLTGKDRIASPVTVKSLLQHDPGLAEMGGPPYLARLAGAATSLLAIKDYGQMIVDLACLRQIKAICAKAQEMLQEQHAVEDPMTLVSELEGDIMDVREWATSKPIAVSFYNAGVDAITEMNDAYRDGDEHGCRTGLKALHKIIGGFMPGDVTILAGRPSMGKTTAGLAIATGLAKSPKDGAHGVGSSVIIASCEMTASDLMRRHISAEMYHRGLQVDYARMRSGGMSEGEFRKVITMLKECEDDVLAQPIQIVGQNNGNALNTIIGEIRAAARRFKEDAPLGAVMVDYLGMMHIPGFRGNETAETTVISRTFKELAKSLNVPIILLCQLSRAVENRPIMQRRPVLSDLRQSGAIEQDADNVIFVYRDAHYLAKHLEDPEVKKDFDLYSEIEGRMNRCSKQMELIVAKNRNGPLGTAKVFCDLPFNALRDLSEDPRQMDMEGFA